MFQALGHKGVSPAAVPCISPELFVHLLGQAVAHAPQPVKYRKLSLFWEPFEVCLEQATEIVKGWPDIEAEKKRWLMESLRGPALDLVHSPGRQPSHWRGRLAGGL